MVTTDVTEYEATVRHTGLSFGEAPRWHDGRLWYSDFFRHAVCSLGDDGERVEHELAAQPSGLGWLDDGTLLVVSMTDQRVLAVGRNGEVRTHADIAEHCGYWANDMVVAVDGTAYVGNFGFDLDAWLDGVQRRPEGAEVPRPPTTVLVVLAPDGSVRQLVEDLAFPNGVVLSEDGRTLIVAETMGGRLTAFDVAVDGTCSGRRTFAQLRGPVPDGICLDAEGQVWMANALAPECLRVAEGGEVTARVATSQTSFACMLGGADRCTLFAMTAPTSTASAAAGTRDARVEAARVDVPGAGRP
jgi:sugar lactone lactonase YvrE